MITFAEGSVFDVRELGRRVARGRRDRVARDDVEPARLADLFEVRHSRLAVVVVAVDERHLGLVALLHERLHRLGDLGVVDRDLEHPLVLRDRRHHAHARRVGDERHVRLLGQRRDRQ
jgi:hypothetical protein